MAFQIVESTARELFDELPEDLTISILRRLEQKAAARAARVSKSWLRLIAAHCIPRTNPSGLPFAGELCLGSATTQHFWGVVVFMNNVKAPPVVTRILNDKKFWPSGIIFGKSFMDICNGLILFCHSDADHDECEECNALATKVENTQYQYYVFNRFTGQCVRVAKPFRPEERSYAALAYDPSCSCYFRIIQFDRFLGEDACMGVYCSETRAWKRLWYSLGEDVAAATWTEQSFFLGGAIYRLSMSGHLLRFEIEKEVSLCAQAKAIELPNKANFSQGCIGVSENEIYFMAFDEETSLHIWALMISTDDGCEWALRRVVPNLHVQREFEGSFMRPLGFHPNLSIAFIGMNSQDLGSLIVGIQFDVDEDIISGFQYVDRDRITWVEDWDDVLAFPSLSCHVPFASGFD